MVTWNCNGALRNKTKRLDSLNSDVYVVQECEDPSLSTDAFKIWSAAYLWIGTSKHKGLGVFPKNGNSIRPVKKYLQIHKFQLRRNKIVLLGDFNSNRRWDQPDHWWNHSDVIEELAAIGLQSVCHRQINEHQGQESTLTFFLQRNLSKAYHIDYVFASDNILQRCKLEVDQSGEWLSISDHMPVTLDILKEL